MVCAIEFCCCSLRVVGSGVQILVHVTCRTLSQREVLEEESHCVRFCGEESDLVALFLSHCCRNSTFVHPTRGRVRSRVLSLCGDCDHDRGVPVRMMIAFLPGVSGCAIHVEMCDCIMYMTKVVFYASVESISGCLMMPACESLMCMGKVVSCLLDRLRDA